MTVSRQERVDCCLADSKHGSIIWCGLGRRSEEGEMESKEAPKNDGWPGPGRRAGNETMFRREWGGLGFENGLIARKRQGL